MILCLMLFTGCNDQEVHQLHPDIAVAPDEVDFGGVVVHYSDQQLIQVANAGRAPLKIHEIWIDNYPNVLSVEPTSAEIEADEAIPVAIDFAPLTYLVYNTRLVIESDDPDTPLIEVPILAEGVDGLTPDIDFDALSLDYGVMDPGASETRYLTLSNVGDADLVIGAAELVGSDAFTVLVSPEGSILAPGGTFTLIVTYAPEVGSEGDAASYAIVSNDPDEALSSLTFLGNGGGDYEYPQARFDCPTGVSPRDYLTLDGSDSYDPNGLEITTWEWSLTDQPWGSTTELDTSIDRAHLFVDMAGDFEVQLQVVNEVGIRSEPTTCAFDAIPSERVHIELTWNTGADLDLHLVRGGGALFEKPDDCNFCNKSPSWGATLELDDITGYGPENTVVDDPASGTYEIKVHNYNDHGDPETVATVNVYIDGSLYNTWYETLAEDELWEVGTIHWSDAPSVIEDATEPYEWTGVKDCY